MQSDFDKLPLWQQMELLTRLRFVAAFVAASEVTASINKSSSGAVVAICADCEHGGNCAVPQRCRLNLPSLFSPN